MNGLMTPRGTFGPRKHCSRCGKPGAAAVPNWIERADRLPGGPSDDVVAPPRLSAAGLLDALHAGDDQHVRPLIAVARPCKQPGRPEGASIAAGRTEYKSVAPADELNLGAFPATKSLVRTNGFGDNMAFFSPTVLYPPIATHDTASTTSERPRNGSASTSTRLNSSDIAFGVWASIILIALALMSAVLGVAPLAGAVI
jgi:hypothetical protein